MYSITEDSAVDNNDSVRFELSCDEALVLFNLLATYEEVDFDSADRKVLSSLGALFEIRSKIVFPPR
jgi:hypothetical protein